MRKPTVDCVGQHLGSCPPINKQSIIWVIITALHSYIVMAANELGPYANNALNPEQEQSLSLMPEQQVCFREGQITSPRCKISTLNQDLPNGVGPMLHEL